MAEDKSKKEEQGVNEGEEQEQQPTEEKSSSKKKPTAKKKTSGATKKKASSTASKKSTTKKKAASSSRKSKKDADDIKEQKPVMTFSGESSAPKKKTKKDEEAKPPMGVLGLVIGGIVLLLLIFAGWYQTQQMSKESQKEASSLKKDVSTEVNDIKSRLENLSNELNKQKLKEKEEVFTVYENETLGITFKYPEELGEVNEDVIKQEVEAPTEESSAPEKVLTLTFSQNPDIWLVAATENASAEREEALLYTGGTENLREQCEDPLDVTTEGYCDHVGYASQQTIEQVLPTGEEALQNVVKNVPLNVSGEYSGLTVNLSLGLPPVAERNLFSEPTEEERQAALEDFFRKIVKEENLSLITKENLAAYEKILETLEVE